MVVHGRRGGDQGRRVRRLRLATDHVGLGEANVSYASRPADRSKGYVTRAVRLALEFLRDHTGARFAEIVSDEADEASGRVAQAVGASPIGHCSVAGRTVARHRLHL